jgi:predicted MPP superfamily phosphohydrolase
MKKSSAVLLITVSIICIIGISLYVACYKNGLHVGNKNNSSNNHISSLSSNLLPSQNVSTLSVPQKQMQNHRFVFIADTRGDYNGVNKTALTKILQLIKALTPQPEYIIVGGDLVGGNKDTTIYKSQLQTFKTIMSAYYPMNIILPAFGNHENVGNVNNTHEKIFGDIFNEFSKASALKGYNNTVYYVDDANVRLIILNSDYQGESEEIIKGQLDWLKSSTKTGNKIIKFVFVHEPPYPTGSHVGSSLDVYPTKRDQFWQVIDNNNVMALFCGHEHNYSRRIIDKSFSPLYTRAVNQIIAGTAGAPVYTAYTSKKGVVVPPNPVYHFSIIDVGQSSTTIKVISIDSKVIDEFTLQNIY